MHYLIDGHNLIAKLPDVSLDDPNDEVELILRLKGWAAASPKRKITVYFDGGLPGGGAHRLSSSAIKVLFAPEGKTADSLIIKRIRAVKNPPEYCLVTSDQQIINVAQQRRMPHLLADAFATKMGDDQQKRHAPPPPQDTDDTPLSESEIAEWLELFGPEPEIPSRPRPSRQKRSPKPIPPQKPKRRRTAQELKTADSKLDENEINEWLDLFTHD